MATPDRDDAIEEPLLSPGFTCRVERAPEETPVRPPARVPEPHPRAPQPTVIALPPPSALPQARDPPVSRQASSRVLDDHDDAPEPPPASKPPSFARLLVRLPRTHIAPLPDHVGLSRFPKPDAS